MSQRRRFLQLLGGGTLSLGLGARAQGAPSPADVLWVNLQARGGWDPALFCDPKPKLRAPFIAKQVGYLDQGVREVKTGDRARALTYLGFADFEQPAPSGFFATYGRDLLIINGIDARTVDHSIGERYFCTGSTNNDFPSFAATVAAAFGRGRPLALMDMGGFCASTPELAPARLGGTGALAWLPRFAKPSLVDRHGGELARPETVRLLRAAQAERLQRLHDGTRLPDARAGLGKLRELRAAQEDLAKLDFAHINRDLRTPDMVFVQKAVGTNVIPKGQEYRYPDMPSERRAQFEIAFEAFRKRLASSMVMGVSGFDSHGENEQNQATAVRRLLGFASYAHSRATRLGIPIAVLMTSDFGRSVGREGAGGSGTGHWPVGSVALLLNDAARRILRVPTGLTIGGTTADLRPRKIHPRTHELDPGVGGVVLSPGHVVRGLRALAGIDGAPLVGRYELRVDAGLELRAG